MRQKDINNLNDINIIYDIKDINKKDIKMQNSYLVKNQYGRKIKFCYYQCDGYDKNCESYISQSLVDNLKKEK